MHTIEYLQVGNKLFPKIKKLAKKYYELTGKPLGITGEVAEYEVVRLLHLDICYPRQEGYNAVDHNGKKVQITGRVIQPGSKKSQRVPTIKQNKEWDYVLLVLLNEKYKTTVIYKANRKPILKAINNSNSKAVHEGGQLSISKFKKLAIQIYP